MSQVIFTVHDVNSTKKIPDGHTMTLILNQPLDPSQDDLYIDYYYINRSNWTYVTKEDTEDVQMKRERLQYKQDPQTHQKNHLEGDIRFCKDFMSGFGSMQLGEVETVVSINNIKSKPIVIQDSAEPKEKFLYASYLLDTSTDAGATWLSDDDKLVWDVKSDKWEGALWQKEQILYESWFENKFKNHRIHFTDKASGKVYQVEDYEITKDEDRVTLVNKVPSPESPFPRRFVYDIDIGNDMIYGAVQVGQVDNGGTVKAFKGIKQLPLVVEDEGANSDNKKLFYASYLLDTSTDAGAVWSSDDDKLVWDAKSYEWQIAEWEEGEILYESWYGDNFADHHVKFTDKASGKVYQVDDYEITKDENRVTIVNKVPSPESPFPRRFVYDINIGRKMIQGACQIGDNGRIKAFQGVRQPKISEAMEPLGIFALDNRRGRDCGFLMIHHNQLMINGKRANKLQFGDDCKVYWSASLANSMMRCNGYVQFSDDGKKIINSSFAIVGNRIN